MEIREAFNLRRKWINSVAQFYWWKWPRGCCQAATKGCMDFKSYHYLVWLFCWPPHPPWSVGISSRSHGWGWTETWGTGGRSFSGGRSLSRTMSRINHRCHAALQQGRGTNSSRLNSDLRAGLSSHKTGTTRSPSRDAQNKKHCGKLKI